MKKHGQEENIESFKENSKNLFVALAIFFGAMWVFFTVMDFITAPEPELTAKEVEGRKDRAEMADKYMQELDAITVCQSEVRRRLKSPSTASFSWSAKEHLSEGAPSIYVLRSYVDSQNGFGATVRTSFTCNADCAGSRCEVVALEINQ